MEPPAIATVNDEGCWITKSGRYRFRYEQLVGPIPAGMTLDHECHNRAAHAGTCNGGRCRHRFCENPEHLVPLPMGPNHRASPLTHAGATHCPQGHPYDEENTDHRGGKRYCRACAREYQRKLRAKRSAAFIDVCRNGHVRTTENTYRTWPDGLGCRDCQVNAGGHGAHAIRAAKSS